MTLTWRGNLTSLYRYAPSCDEFVFGSRLGSIPNLNNIHGTVHTTVGGGTFNGNMGYVPSAGLDPIFFLYHMYVIRPLNRLLAINLAELDSDE